MARLRGKRSSGHRIRPRCHSRITGVRAREQGVSPFLFTFRLVAFNYASYPALSMPYGPAWTCSGGGARSSHGQETSPSRVHSTPVAVRFCCRAGPPGPPACAGPPASRRGDFPQCRTLSATLLLPHFNGEANQHEPLGHHLALFARSLIGKHHSQSPTRRARGQGRGTQA